MGSGAMWRFDRRGEEKKRFLTREPKTDLSHRQNGFEIQAKASDLKKHRLYKRKEAEGSLVLLGGVDHKEAKRERTEQQKQRGRKKMRGSNAR